MTRSASYTTVTDTTACRDSTTARRALPYVFVAMLPDADGGSTCRFCASRLELTLVDLGMSPLCESFVPPERLDVMEPFFPLRVRVCSSCWLAQLPAYVDPTEIFSEYPYFASYSTSWVEHARRFVEAMRHDLRLGPDDLVVEIASNDGYLLQHLVGSHIPILGIEPAANVARAAEEKGVPTLVEFFGRGLAARLVHDRGHARLVVANNVLAQVPDLHDFVSGIATLLRRDGVCTLEFPHLLRLLEGVQYDTIYHEHFSYFSLGTARRIFQAHGLDVVDVEELPTHGGSLRVYVRHSGASRPSAAVDRMLHREEAWGLRSPEPYLAFSRAVEEARYQLLELLISLRRAGKRVVGYGAPGKGNTLLNYCGIRSDLVEFTVDRNPHKHGLFTPGTRIPIHPVERIAQERPDYLLVLPWNLLGEISSQLAYASEWGAKLIVPVPSPRIVEPGSAVSASESVPTMRGVSS